MSNKYLMLCSVSTPLVTDKLEVRMIENRRIKLRRILQVSIVIIVGSTKIRARWALLERDCDRNEQSRDPYKGQTLVCISSAKSVCYVPVVFLLLHVIAMIYVRTLFSLLQSCLW